VSRGTAEEADAAGVEAAEAENAPALDVVQRWFQAVVTHPDGVAGGLASPAARRFVPLDRGGLERLVRRSSRLTAEQRLSIYANAYYARLLECLADCFPVLRRVLGAEVFAGFAFDYLQRYPSRSYTLDRLAESFPRFLEETRPDRSAPAAGRQAPAPGSDPEPAQAPPAWPDFLIDLATLELAIAQVFDGPGAEGEPLLTAADLAPLRADGRFAAARLKAVPCLRLLRFRYPVNAFYTVARRAAGPPGGPADELPFPEPAVEHVALSRTDFVVRRHELSPLEHAILAALLAGAGVGEAIAAGAAASELPDGDLADRLDAAFRRWTAAGFFRAVEPSVDS
jgi:Putative DNA-binding domain